MALSHEIIQNSFNPVFDEDFGMLNSSRASSLPIPGAMTLEEREEKARQSMMKLEMESAMPVEGILTPEEEAAMWES